MRHITALVLLATMGITATAAATAAPLPAPGDSERCRLVRPGMEYRDAMRIMRREPDSVLSGHTAAWDGNPPGSYAIEFRDETTADGVRMTSSLRIENGRVTEVDCGRKRLTEAS